jgi:hypothetical protein
MPDEMIMDEMIMLMHQIMTIMMMMMMNDAVMDFSK